MSRLRSSHRYSVIQFPLSTSNSKLGLRRVHKPTSHPPSHSALPSSVIPQPTQRSISMSTAATSQVTSPAAPRKLSDSFETIDLSPAAATAMSGDAGEREDGDWVHAGSAGGEERRSGEEFRIDEECSDDDDSPPEGGERDAAGEKWGLVTSWHQCRE